MNKPIKCFQIIPNLIEGGAEKIALYLSSELDKKYDVTLVSLYKSQNTVYERIAREKGLKLIFLDKKKGFDCSLIWQLYLLFRQEKPDIVHTHLYGAKYILVPAILSGVKARIHTVHSMADKELGKTDRLIMKQLYRCFRFVPVAISDFIKNTIYQIYHIQPDKIPCIYNSIDISLYTPVSERSFESQLIWFCAIGSLRPVKNHALLIDAFCKAYAVNKNIRLRIIGDGVLRNELSQKIDNLGLNSVVSLLGVRGDIPELLLNSDVFTLSSSHEGLPLSILEAMASGLPIISTSVGGVPDVLKDGRNGLLVESGDVDTYSKAILRLADDKKLRCSMSTNNLADAPQYDIKQMAIKYGQLYDAIINKKS